MQKRGVIYVVYGDKAEKALERSMASVQKHNPSLPIKVVRFPPSTDRLRGHQHKSSALQHSPFAQTLLLDVDTVVMGPLDFGFERAAVHGMACCINEAPWARRCVGSGVHPQAVEYNSGVLFFSRAAEPVLKRWEALAATLDSRMIHSSWGYVAYQPYSDQASFARAIQDMDITPFVLPHNWNFRPLWHRTFYGPLRIWHSYADVPQLVDDINARYFNTGAPFEKHRMDPALLADEP